MGSNLHVAEQLPRTTGDEIKLVARTKCDPLAEGSERRRKVRFLEVIKPGDGGVGTIDTRVQHDCPERWEEHLKTRNIVERHSEQGEPINKSIAGQSAKGMQLIETRTERLLSERAVEIVRNVPETVAAGCPRKIGDQEAAARENPANAVCERWPGLDGGDGHSAGSRRLRARPGREKLLVAVIQDSAVCPEFQTNGACLGRF